MPVHNIAAYCKTCARVQCKCKPLTMDRYNLWHPPTPEPAEVVQLGGRYELALEPETTERYQQVRAAKKTAMREFGECYLERAKDMVSTRTIMGRKGARIY